MIRKLNDSLSKQFAIKYVKASNKKEILQYLVDAGRGLTGAWHWPVNKTHIV